ncbi:hypothetical protein GCM10022215_01810 [Nocardioides fonticola]|uniref:Cell division protein FtsQ n=1 Tax=Nocardioides fonticola TaxID=450363 RepID=A0ABP7X9R0_9ACTN
MRRRFARRQWARRLLTARRALVLLGLVAVAAVAVWAVWFSSWLSVAKVEVHGTSQLTAAQVENAARVPLGGPLATVDLGAIRTRVEALAGVASADVTRSWPDGVRIDVTERQAVAVVRIGGLLRGMDAGGVVFRTYRTAPVGLPAVTTGAGTSAEALAEAAAVVTSLPQEVAVKVDHIDVRSVDAIALVLRDGRTVEWGNSTNSRQKAEVLGALLRQQARVYDVSVPSKPTTRG